MWTVLGQAAVPGEPAPSGWTATGETLLRHAEQRPDAFWPVVAVALPLALVIGIGLIVIKWLLPAWREEKKADREALVTALRQRGEEAAKDAEKDRELAKMQNDGIVQRIEGRVERVSSEITRLDARVERHGELLAPTREAAARQERISAEIASLNTNVQRILVKLGLSVLLAFVLCTPGTTASGVRAGTVSPSSRSSAERAGQGSPAALRVPDSPPPSPKPKICRGGALCAQQTARTPPARRKTR